MDIKNVVGLMMNKIEKEGANMETNGNKKPTPKKNTTPKKEPTPKKEEIAKVEPEKKVKKEKVRIEKYYTVAGVEGKFSKAYKKEDIMKIANAMMKTEKYESLKDESWKVTKLVDSLYWTIKTDTNPESKANARQRANADIFRKIFNDGKQIFTFHQVEIKLESTKEKKGE